MVTCRVCNVVGPEPCEDVIVESALALVRAEPDPAPLRRALATGSLPVCPMVAVPFLVAQPAWPAVLAAARRHDGSACDPVECDACVSRLSLLQVEDWYWRAFEGCVTCRGSP